MDGQLEANWGVVPIPGKPSPRLWPAPPADAQPLMVGKLRCGCEWHDVTGHFCLLTDAVFVNDHHSRADETSIIFDRLEALLDRAGLTFGHVLRTWFFLDDITSWYADFNRVRSRFYSERGLLGRAPASTAVGVAGLQHSALKAHLLAFRPAAVSTKIAIADSPLQSAALDYGSAFSRAVRLTWDRGKRLYVSGTASIDVNGRTLFAGDTEAQTRETFRVVRALLERHGLDFRDVTHATGYFPNPADERVVRQAWKQHLELDVGILPAEICRRDLSFEIELIAERWQC